MIRSFDWRDVGLVKALADRGVCLDSETGLTQGTHPLQQALLAYLMPMGGPPTLIWREGGDEKRADDPPGDKRGNGAAPERAVFGQLRHRPGDEHARIAYMAPVVDHAADGWQAVVERLAVEAGERRAQNILAEVNEKSPEFDVLREVGFAIYARQTLWKLPIDASPPPAEPAGLRPATRSDTVAVATLYSNVVPRLVQQVEPGPLHSERGYVLESGGELLAYMDVRRGPHGVWVEPFLHPEAYDQSEAVVRAFVHHIARRKEKPLYLCVRRYQDWLQSVVDRVGFELLGSQAVMVKRLAVRLAEARLRPLPAVEGKAASPVTSVRFAVGDDESRGPGRTNPGTPNAVSR